MIENKIVRIGHKKAIAHIKLKLNGYRSVWRRVYVGATAHPQRRWVSHASDGWTKMVLLYKAFTPEIVQAMERNLIENARQSNFLLDLENVAPGGEGVVRIPRPNYLYVLVADRRAWHQPLPSN
ncbi:hypothetical protein [Hyalangium rubrum]|uniref:GIY-YIG domain-containing protein n=1 Tax=Hyalangium rubrum TaxID=3103134 RepID=A0ABU5H101_9BACT|nr:hypothetical protein [Hyalangium sp. s54d21]MDY7226809.1 hypothetical protein [Hyalangium sp. s54d21]